MSSAVRLAVFTVPSPRLEDWKSAISNQAHDLGWMIGHADVAPTDEAEALLITQDMTALEAFSATHFVVLFDEPDACLAPVAEAPIKGIRANEVRSAVSAPWAAASQLADSGAVVADSRSGTIVLPGLGQLSAPQMPPMADCGIERGVLSVFDRLPVPVGATALWTPAQFDYPFEREFFGGTPDIDLTGRPRGLVYGPFVHLPPGVWQVDIDISIDPERGRAPLRFDWGSGDDFVTTFAAVTVPGRYSLSLINRWESTTIVQMRIWLMEGIFQGKLSFHGCRLTRISDDTPTTTHELA